MQVSVGTIDVDNFTTNECKNVNTIGAIKTRKTAIAMLHNWRQLMSVFLGFNYEAHNTSSYQILAKSDNSRLS